MRSWKEGTTFLQATSISKKTCFKNKCILSKPCCLPCVLYKLKGLFHWFLLIFVSCYPVPGHRDSQTVAGGSDSFSYTHIPNPQGCCFSSIWFATEFGMCVLFITLQILCLAVEFIPMLFWIKSFQDGVWIFPHCARLSASYWTGILNGWFHILETLLLAP